MSVLSYQDMVPVTIETKTVQALYVPCPATMVMCSCKNEAMVSNQAMDKKLVNDIGNIFINKLR